MGGRGAGGDGRRRLDHAPADGVHAGRDVGRAARHAAHVVSGVRIGGRSLAHIVTRVRISRRERAHVVARMRINGRRLGRSPLHPAHVMAGVRVGRSRRSGAHAVTGMRIDRSRLGAVSSMSAHVMTSVRVRRRRGRRRSRPRRGGAWLGFGRGPRSGLRRTGGRGLGAMACMPAVRLGQGGTGGQYQGQNCDGGEQGAAHRAAPSSGRTVTTLNIPACMCISRWQWKAQSPGASAVRSNVTLEPGATLTVCFSG
ncbi:hypothetical protein D3C87_313330 [compost metagenome]